MLRSRTMSLIAVGLLVSQSGCVNRSGNNSSPVADKSALERICPTPTNRANRQAILRYLEHTESNSDLDALAEEWERLDSGARLCKV